MVQFSIEGSSCAVLSYLDTFICSWQVFLRSTRQFFVPTKSPWSIVATCGMITNTSWKRRPTTLFYQTSSSLVACLLEGKQLAYSSSNLHSQVMNFYWKIDALFQGISTWNSLVCKYLFFLQLDNTKGDKFDTTKWFFKWSGQVGV